jgi:hypothetical protein
MAQRQPDSLRSPIPRWLRVLGALAIAAMAAGAVYAVAIGAANFGRIGV